MPTSSGDFEHVVRATRDRLYNNFDWPEIATILDLHGVKGYDPEFPHDSIIRPLTRAGEDALDALNTDLTQRGIPALAGNESKVLLFASHIAAKKNLVAEVADELASFGVDVFVAHQSIAEGSPSWRIEVFNALRSSDAGVAFLHDGFVTSEWCDQEVGWLLGREIPVVALQFGFAPYGPLGESQAVDARGLTSQTMAARVLDVLDKSVVELSQSLNFSLLDALTKSTSFAMTDLLWERLAPRRNLTVSQARLVLDALQLNSQVSRASEGGWKGRPYKDVLLDLLKEQPSWDFIRDWAEAI